ncbi:MAG: helix-turn-helix transcriptional regulator [Thermacetogeniaceae bacterium]
MLCSLASAIHIYRLLAQLSTTELARQLGVSQATVAAWESETRKVSLEAALRWFNLIYSEERETTFSLINTIFAVEHAITSFTDESLSSAMFFPFVALQELAVLLQKYPILRDAVSNYCRNKNKKTSPQKEWLRFGETVWSELSIQHLLFNGEGIVLNPAPKREVILVTEQDRIEFINFLKWFIFTILCRIDIKFYNLNKFPYSPPTISKKLIEILANENARAEIQAALIKDNSSSLYILSPRQRIDLYRLCFTGFSWQEKYGIPGGLSFYGVSGNVYNYYDDWFKLYMHNSISAVNEVLCKIENALNENE